MPSGLSPPFSSSVSDTGSPTTPASPASMPAGAFHTPACAVGAGVGAGDRAAGREGGRRPAAQRVGPADPREVDRRVAHVRPGQPAGAGDPRRQGRGDLGAGRVDDEEGAPLGAEGRRFGPDGVGQVAGRGRRRDAEDR